MEEQGRAGELTSRGAPACTLLWLTCCVRRAPQEGAATPGAAHIECETEVRVWCEVLPPFNAMPRTLLSGACNAVLRRAVPALLSAFIRQLAADYARWSTDAAYRQLRRDAAASARAQAALPE